MANAPGKFAIFLLFLLPTLYLISDLHNNMSRKPKPYLAAPKASMEWKTSLNTSKLDVSKAHLALHAANADRRELLQNFCKNLNFASEMTKREERLKAELRKSFFFLPEQKIAYCSVPKAASSTLLANFQRLGNVGYLRRDEMRGKLSSLLDANMSDEQILNDFTFFAFVRHPWSRLISGYINAMIKGKGWRFASRANIELRDAIFAESPVQTDFRFSTYQAGIAPTPKQFVEYLLAAPKKSGWSGINVHFRPQWHKCPFCTVDFDFVGHVESFKKDVNLLSKVLNISILRPSVKLNARSEPNKTAKFFSWLTPKMYDDFENLYSVDFDMFGYKRNQYRHLVPQN